MIKMYVIGPAPTMYNAESFEHSYLRTKRRGDKNWPLTYDIKEARFFGTENEAWSFLLKEHFENGKRSFHRQPPGDKPEEGYGTYYQGLRVWEVEVVHSPVYRLVNPDRWGMDR